MYTFILVSHVSTKQCLFLVICEQNISEVYKAGTSYTPSGVNVEIMVTFMEPVCDAYGLGAQRFWQLLKINWTFCIIYALL